MSRYDNAYGYVASSGRVAAADFITIYDKATLRYMLMRGYVKRDGDTLVAGVEQGIRKLDWTAADDAVLRDTYPHGAELAFAALPHRTADAIHKRASKLGIKRRDQRPPSVDKLGRLLRATPLPAYTRGNLSPVVRSCIVEAA